MAPEIPEIPPESWSPFPVASSFLPFRNSGWAHLPVLVTAEPYRAWAFLVLLTRRLL